MVRRSRTAAVCTALLAASAPHSAYCQQNNGEHHPSPQLDIAWGNSDEYAESVLTAKAPPSKPGIGEQDHATISSILETTKEMVDTGKILVQDERTLKKGQDLMERANVMFREVKDLIREKNAGNTRGTDAERNLLRHKYSDHDVQMAQERDQEDEKRALDISRRIFETMTTFPECVEQLLEVCLEIINSDLASLGLSTIEVVVHEKRNANQEGYNKVVIITNELADRVKGRTGEGIVEYPFLWNDSAQGPRALGVDGKWNCNNLAPEDCCNLIKQSVPGPDFRGKTIECHIFVPFGGVGNPRRNDRVFINLSPDGRVHEPPIIQ